MRKFLAFLSVFLYACPGYVPYPDAGGGTSSSSEASSCLGESSSSSVESSLSSEHSSESSSPVSSSSSSSSSSQSPQEVSCGIYNIPLPQDTPNQTTTVRVDGSNLKKDGVIFAGRGVNVHDQRSCAACAFESPGVGLAEAQRRLEFAAAAGSTFVRLLLESYTPDLAPSWAGLEADPVYREGVRALLVRATELDLIVLLSVWDAPSLRPQGWPSQEGDPQLCAMVAITHDLPNVIIGVSNEPENNFGGEDNAAAYAAMARASGTVRSFEAASGSVEHVIAVQGLAQWGRTLAYYVDNPIPDANGQIVYESHPYNPREDFEAVVFGPAATLPVIIGEFGPDTFGYQTLGDALHLADEAIARDIPFTAWTLHPNCPPNLLQMTNFACVQDELLLTEWGVALFAKF